MRRCPGESAAGSRRNGVARSAIGWRSAPPAGTSPATSPSTRTRGRRPVRSARRLSSRGAPSATRGCRRRSRSCARNAAQASGRTSSSEGLSGAKVGSLREGLEPHTGPLSVTPDVVPDVLVPFQSALPRRSAHTSPSRAATKVVRCRPADDPLETHTVEGIRDRRDGCLRGQALAPAIGGDHPPDLVLLRRRGPAPSGPPPRESAESVHVPVVLVPLDGDHRTSPSAARASR